MYHRLGTNIRLVHVSTKLVKVCSRLAVVNSQPPSFFSGKCRFSIPLKIKEETKFQRKKRGSKEAITMGSS